MNKNKQRGVTLLEMILVVGLIATMTLISLFEKQLEMEQMQAKKIGAELYTFNNAIRKWIANNPSPTAVTHNGTQWLKPNSCGGSSGRVEGYLPCDFPLFSNAEPSSFGRLAFTTRITVANNTPTSADFSIPTTRTTVTTETTPFTLPGRAGGSLRTDLAGLAALSAAGGIVLDAGSPLGASTDSSFRSNFSTGVITITAQNDFDNDAWLRTDGGNRMKANIRFDSTIPRDSREIQGISRLQALASEVLYIGNSNSDTSAFPLLQGVNQVNDPTIITRNTNTGAAETDREARVVIDSDARVYGSLKANNDLISERAISKVYTAEPNTAVSIKSTQNTDIPIATRVDRIDLSAGNGRLSVERDYVAASGTISDRVNLKGKINVDQLFINKNGVDVGLDKLLPNYVFMASWYALNGQYVTKPTCGTGGIPKIIVVPQTIPTNTARPSSGYSLAPVGASFFYATDAGTMWTVQASVWSGSYGGNGSAIATTYCLYGN